MGCDRSKPFCGVCCVMTVVPSGQAMEIGRAALNILVDCWDGHLTPPEVASLADRASRARDANMVRAAAELALSCLPHAHALNPNEIQRALLQCKEQVNHYPAYEVKSGVKQLVHSVCLSLFICLSADISL